MSEAFELAQRQLQAMDRQLANLEAQLQEANRAKLTLENLQPGGDMLVPIGAGIHIPATAGQLDDIVIPVGADYLVAGSVAEAAAKLQAHMDMLQSAMQNMRSRMEELMAQMQDA